MNSGLTVRKNGRHRSNKYMEDTAQWREVRPVLHFPHNRILIRLPLSSARGLAAGGALGPVVWRYSLAAGDVMLSSR